MTAPRSLRRFWSSLRSRPDPAGVEAEWRDWTGPEFDLVQRYLQPLPELAASYPCPRPGGDGCPRQVVTRPGPDRRESYVAVCGCSPRECDPVELTRQELVLYRPNIERILRELRAALGVAGPSGEIDGVANAWRVGVFKPEPSLRAPVFLVWRAESQSLTFAVADLLAQEADPTFLLLPDIQDVTRPARAEMDRRGAIPISLDRTVGVDPDSGRLATVLSPEALRALLPSAPAPSETPVAHVITHAGEGPAGASETGAILGTDRDTFDLVVDGIRNQIWKRGSSAPGKFRAKNHVHVLRDVIDARRAVLPDDLLSVRHVSPDGGGRAEQVIRMRNAIEGPGGRRFIKSPRLDDDTTAYQWAPDPGLRFALIFPLESTP